MGLSNFLGRFSKVTGTVNFDQMAPEQSVLNVEVDMRTIDTHVPELDSSLPNSVFQSWIISGRNVRFHHDQKDGRQHRHGHGQSHDRRRDETRDADCHVQWRTGIG